MKVLIPESHEVVLHLPSDVPAGAAEIIVLAEGEPRATELRVEEWLNDLARGVPPSPVIPLEALRRENMYE
jgi:hypothetical protein